MTDFINIFLPPDKVSMKVGLFFGSFNPIHIGHMAIANYMVEFTGLKQVWFVVSPQNPFKKKEDLLNDLDRLELVQRAVGDDSRFRATDVEFRMPKPSYTIDTLTSLSQKYPNHHFSLIMGSDNLVNFRQWKNYQEILDHYPILVYPRPGDSPMEPLQHKNVLVINAPQMEISSTFLRKAILEGHNMRCFFPDKVWEYIDKLNFYR